MKNEKILSNVFVDPELTVICKHCGKLIDQVKLMGFSLICPLCGKPQNGEPHLKLKDTIFAFPRRDTHRKTAAAKSPAAFSADPFGDVYPVVEVEGISPEYNARLQAMGIVDTHQLWKADAEKVAKKAGVPVLTVHNWQDMAELSSVRGIGPQHAELLERSGIHTVEQLRKADPDELLSLVRKKQESLKVNIEGNRPSHSTIEHWIEEARGKKGSPTTVKHWAEELHGGHRGNPA